MNKSNYVPTICNNEALDTEIVDNEKNNFQTIDKCWLAKGLKASEDELKQLANIATNWNLARQQEQKLINQHYQDYIKDIGYQNYIITSHNESIQYAMQRGIQFWKSYDNQSIFYRVNAFAKKQKLNAEKNLYPNNSIPN